jgi:hypothetical protein
LDIKSNSYKLVSGLELTLFFFRFWLYLP